MPPSLSRDDYKEGKVEHGNGKFSAFKNINCQFLISTSMGDNSYTRNHLFCVKQ